MTNQQSALYGIANHISQLSAQDYYREQELGNLSFIEYGPLLKRAISTASAWTDEDFIREQQQPDIDHANLLENIKSYNPRNIQNAAAERAGIASRIQSALNDLFGNNPRMSGLIAFYTLKKQSEFISKIENIKVESGKLIEAKLEEFAKPLKLAQDELSQIQKLKLDAEAAVNAVRGLSQTESLQKYSTFYGQEAVKCKNAALIWGIASGLLTGTLLWYLIWLTFWWTEKHMQTEVLAAIQAGATKLALFSVAFYVTAWCGRNFKAQWHLYVTNRHRANTLNALDAFASSAKDSTTREGILLHASNAIFSHGNTGFLPDVNDSPTTPSILEIIRGGQN